MYLALRMVLLLLVFFFLILNVWCVIAGAVSASSVSNVAATNTDNVFSYYKIFFPVSLY